MWQKQLQILSGESYLQIRAQGIATTIFFSQNMNLQSKRNDKNIQRNITISKSQKKQESAISDSKIIQIIETIRQIIK